MPHQEASLQSAGRTQPFLRTASCASRQPLLKIRLLPLAAEELRSFARDVQVVLQFSDFEQPMQLLLERRLQPRQNREPRRRTDPQARLVLRPPEEGD